MSNTLRLIMPQWQGGNNPSYSFGAKLLAWLAPADADSRLVEVPVEPYEGSTLNLEQGVVGRAVLLQQIDSAAEIIEKAQPERIITFGGDCLVSQAPFSYLSEKYGESLGVLWLDAHPDVSTPKMHKHVHAMVLGNLLGSGEKEFASKVKVPLKPERVMYGGLQKMTPEEEQIVERLKLRIATPKNLEDNCDRVIDWITENHIRHLAIHLDLDVLAPSLFRSLLFAQPGTEPVNASEGTMTFSQIERIIQDVSRICDIVGFTFAEYLPWDAMNLKKFMENLPIFE